MNETSKQQSRFALLRLACWATLSIAFLSSTIDETNAESGGGLIDKGGGLGVCPFVQQQGVGAGLGDCVEGVNITAPNPAEINASQAGSVTFSGECAPDASIVMLSFPGANLPDYQAICTNAVWSVAGVNVTGAKIVDFTLPAHAALGASFFDHPGFIVDTLAPKILLTQSRIEIPTGSYGGSFDDRDAIEFIDSVIDDRDGLLNPADVQITGVPFNTNLPGQHQVTFSILDGVGNPGISTLDVDIIANDSVSIDLPAFPFIINQAMLPNVTFGGSCSNPALNVNLSFPNSNLPAQNNIDCLPGNTWSVSVNLSGAEVQNYTLNTLAVHGTANDTQDYVFDVLAPKISLSAAFIQIPKGDLGGDFDNNDARPYIASVVDNRDGILPPESVQITGVPFSTNSPGFHDVTYSISDAAGNTGQSILQVEVLNQSHILSLMTPVDHEVGTSLKPHFTWNIQPFDVGYTYNIKVTTDPTCVGSVVFQSNNISGLSYDIPYGGSLEYVTAYYWCVEAFENGNSIANSLATFKTRTEEIPVVSLEVSDPAVQPNGQQEITLHGWNGETGSLAVVYEVIDGQQNFVGQTLMTSSGEFYLSIALSQIQNPQNFKYVAKVKRGDEFGGTSNPAFYEYDPALGLDAVVLLHMSPRHNGRMKFLPSDGADYYRVWRRAGVGELCTPSDTIHCYLNTKPFREVSGSFSTEGAYIVFEDATNFQDLINQANDTGISYFVTAHSDAGQSSLRSNSISFVDTTQVKAFEPESPVFYFVMNPYSADIYACGVQNFDLDSSADLIRHVQYQKRGDNPNCNFKFDGRSTTDINVFNSLDRRVEPNSGQSGCMLVAQYTNLEPNTNYCFDLCFDDVEANDLTCIPDKLAGNTPPDQTPPEFLGIINTFPNPDGESFIAEWSKASPESSIEVILQYEISYTKKVDQYGNPVYKNDLLIISDPDQTTAKIPDVDTGTKYFVRVAALDNSKNKTFGTDPEKEIGLPVTTLNNRPIIKSATLKPTNVVGILSLEITTTDRETPFGDSVSLKDFSVGKASSTSLNSVANFSQRVMYSSTSLQALSASKNTEDSVLLDLRDQLDMDSYSDLKFKVEVEDQLHGYTDTYEANSILNDKLSIQTGNFSSNGLASCSLIVEGSQLSINWWIGILGAMFLLCHRRRKRIGARH